MKYAIEFSSNAQKIIKKWKKSNPNAFKKLYKILPELESHPYSGTGYPEPLKGLGGNVYSRHITAMDRIIYEIFEDHLIVLIIELEGHYQDK